MEQTCFMPALESANSSMTLGSLCRYSKDKMKITFENCTAYRPEPNAAPEECSNLGSNQVCEVFIQLTHLIAHKQLFNENKQPNCSGKGPVVYEFEIKSALFDFYVDGLLLFPNITTFANDNLTLNSIKWDDLVPIKKLMTTNFMNVSWIKITKVESDKPFPGRLFGAGDFENLKGVTVFDSSFKGVESNAFDFTGGNLNELYIGSVNFQKGKFNKDAIKISNYRTNCEQEHNASIIIRNCQLTNSMLEPNFISYSGKKPCKNSRPFNLRISMQENLFERTVSNSSFIGLLGAFLPKKDHPRDTLTLEFDPIDCCANGNLWLFDFTNKSLDLPIKIPVDCDDIGLNITSFGNATRLKEACGERNINPILTIMIVCILMLILLLVALSFLCIFYVIPRRKQVLFLNSKNSDEKLPKPVPKLSGAQQLNTVSTVQTFQTDKTEDIQVQKSKNASPGLKQATDKSSSSHPLAPQRQKHHSPNHRKSPSQTRANNLRSKSSLKSGGKSAKSRASLKISARSKL